ncbi:hypothetical protein KP77_04650 [Jeotgalibacillus alimentarius]|uniref:Dephospho-CoA kinase n=1 Tax=Jeotgalibacillus alimentarius TaxID=135826 RepID=A0A0C2SHQ6_9BACL|nr:GrpB family protein [Jeotgalibacillus alimentarius]KIL53489.1 hypothetical protein KP77_04650 [Jeotgalibacillus alimentarius]
MKLGLKRNEVRLVDYTTEWKEEFERVKKDIAVHTPLEGNRVEHIGSTAIEGMSAKPILDIAAGVDNLQDVDEAIMSGFKEIGFFRLKVERPGEIVFARFTDTTYQEKTHYIHLVEFEGELWNNLIFFRDYLNGNETARKQYEDLKLDYLKHSSAGITEYTDHKEAFVKDVFKKRTV